MLSDHDRETLRAVECQFMVEDPEFARSFRARERQLAARRRRGQAVRIAVVIAALFGALTVAVWSFSGALAFAATAGMVWLVWRCAGAAARRVT